MSNDNNTSMSFLDVMACALGGMAMLFLILAIMPHQGAVAKQRERSEQVSTVPATPKPTQGKVSKEKPVLYSIEHPNCVVEIEPPPVDSPKPVLWSQKDGVDKARRLGYARLLVDKKVKKVKNAKLIFRDCKGPGNFIVTKIKDENSKKDVELLNNAGTETTLHYRAGEWSASDV